MKSHKFAIGIPTINRADLLLPSLKMYCERDFPTTRVWVLDNGSQQLPYRIQNLSITIPPENMGVAASWNRLCEKIFDSGHTHAIILNDDIYWGQREQRISELLQRFPARVICSMVGLQAFIIPRMVFEIVGAFDEAFYPAYFEDNDYLYRLRLMGIPVLRDPLLNPFINRESASSQKDPSLLDRYETNRQHYTSKWGGVPGKERHTLPFGVKKIVRP